LTQTKSALRAQPDHSSSDLQNASAAVANLAAEAADSGLLAHLNEQPQSSFDRRSLRCCAAAAHGPFHQAVVASTPPFRFDVHFYRAFVYPKN